MDKEVVFIDGECNLCNKAVQFILKNEADHELFFESLANEKAIRLLNLLDLKLPQVDSIVMLHNKQFYVKSAAVFHIARHLKWPYKALYYFRWLPLKVTDWIYDIVASNRYRWFGKADHCLLEGSKFVSRTFSIVNQN